MKTSSFICALALIFLLIPASVIFAQPPDSLWQFHFGGIGDDLGFDALEGNPGEYIIVGKTKSFGLTLMPNPVVSGSTIRLETTIPAYTTLTLLNAIGEPVKSLIEGEMVIGPREINFNKGNLQPGVYFLRLVSGELQMVTKMLIMR